MCCWTLELVTLGKSGSADNYFLEWMLAGSVGLGILAASLITAVLAPQECTSPGFSPVTMAVLLALFAYSMVAAPVGTIARNSAGTPDALTRLVDQIRAAPKPVFSEDMTLLLRAGKQVPWEPAIFTQLAKMGVWNQRRVLRLIDTHFFSFIITKGHAGEPLSSGRYTGPVSHAIEKYYPLQQSAASFVIHRPVQP